MLKEGKGYYNQKMVKILKVWNRFHLLMKDICGISIFINNLEHNQFLYIGKYQWSKDMWVIEEKHSMTKISN